MIYNCKSLKYVIYYKKSIINPYEGDEILKVSSEEILHIANLANLTLEEDEIENYLKNLEEILNFANIVDNAPIENLDITIGANEAKNVFRKDEIKIFEDNESLLKNAIDCSQNMFKIPKVLN